MAALKSCSRHAKRAQGAALRALTADQAATLDAMGETLVPGAKDAGITYFVDQQISIPPQEALLEARIMNVKPPFPNFYRAVLGAIDGASSARYGGRNFAQLAGNEQHEFVDLMRQNKLDGWKGPAAGFVYFLLRSDAVDVVYGTMDRYAHLGVPYQPHINSRAIAARRGTAGEKLGQRGGLDDLCHCERCNPALRIASHFPRGEF